jgi:hypothetical protein
MSVLPREIVSKVQIRNFRAGVSAVLAIEVLNIEYNEDGQIIGLDLGPAIVQETVEIIDGYTYFRQGEAVALTEQELAEVATRIIESNQSLEPAEAFE